MSAREIVTPEDTNPHRWNEKFPWLGTGDIPVETCISEEYFEKEREQIFRKTWWALMRVEEVPEPGCFKVKRLHCLDASIIVMRGKDAKIRAFHNVCAHRGNTVISEIPGQYEFSGRAQGHALTCRFHGWVYDTHGRNLFIPNEASFFTTADKDECGLIPIACDTWEGFVFVNLDPRPEACLKEFLGSYGEHMSGYDYGRASDRIRYWTILDCNWKIGVDAFSEGYHVETIHAGSFPCDWCAVDDVELRGPHRTGSVSFNLDSYGPGAVQAVSYRRTSSSLVDRDRAGTMIPPHMNPARRKNYTFELAPLFPNFVINAAEGFYFTHQFWPISVNRTLWEGTYYMTPARTNSERWANHYSQVLQRNAWLEDTQTMEDTHRALLSGARKAIKLADDEVMVRHSYKVVDDWIAGTPRYD